MPLVHCCIQVPVAMLFDVCSETQVNEFVKRVRAAKIHILIMGHLRKQMPAMMGKQKAQEKLLADLSKQFGLVQREYHLPAGLLLQSTCAVLCCAVLCCAVLGWAVLCCSLTALCGGPPHGLSIFVISRYLMSSCLAA